MMSRLRFSVVGLLVMGALAGSAKPAHAVEIVGRFNQTFGDVVVSLGEIDFTPNLNPGLDATATSGSFTVNPSVGSRSGVFLDAVFNTTPSDGTIGDLSNNPADANYVPLDTNISRADYLTLAEKPGWHFTLTRLVSGDSPTIPFFFTEASGNVSVTITQFGTAYDDATPTLITRWTNVVSAQYTNTTAAQLLAIIVAGGSLPQNTWSGTFEATAVPEPATLLTFGLGTLVAGAVRRRRAKK